MVSERDAEATCEEVACEEKNEIRRRERQRCPDESSNMKGDHKDEVPKIRIGPDSTAKETSLGCREDTRP